MDPDLKKERADASYLRKKMNKNDFHDVSDEKVKEKQVTLPEKKPSGATNQIHTSGDFDSILNEKTLNEEVGKV